MYINEKSELRFLINSPKRPSEYLADLATAGSDSTYLKCDDQPFGENLGPQNRIPFVRIGYGRAIMEAGLWGHEYGNGLFDDMQYCRGQTLGYPCCIPASSVLLESLTASVEVRDPDGRNLWLAASYHEEKSGSLISVVPLCLDPGPDLQPYCTLQPLFIPIDAIPTPGVWAFISPYGARHLRHPSPPGSLAVSEWSL